MTNAREALRTGDLNQCLDLLKAEIRQSPSDPEKRVFLFQLYSVLGEWEKALAQLNVARDLNKDNKSMAETYQELLRCEVLRQEVFAGTKTPMLLGDPPEWTAKLVQAIRHFSQGDFAAFEELQSSAYELAEATAGKIYLFDGSEGTEAPEEKQEGNSFEWIADGDMRLGPVLEAVVNGRYYWIPFSNIQSIEIEKPVDLRDLVWTPVAFCWTNQGQAVGFIPTRYPGSWTSGDDALSLARKTEWQSPKDDLFVGLGQRVFTTDTDEYSIQETRRIVFDSGKQ